MCGLTCGVGITSPPQENKTDVNPSPEKDFSAPSRIFIPPLYSSEETPPQSAPAVSILLTNKSNQQRRFAQFCTVGASECSAASHPGNLRFYESAKQGRKFRALRLSTTQVTDISRMLFNNRYISMKASASLTHQATFESRDVSKNLDSTSGRSSTW